ncbi:MAG TPA: ABC transporter ATP-binding protein [Limnochordales bacterium]
MRRHRWRYLAGAAVLLVIDLLQLLIPRVLGDVADAFASGQLSAAYAARQALTLLLLAALISLGRWAWRQLLLGASRLLEADLRRRLFAHLQRMSSGYFVRHRVGDLMAHLTNDVQAVRMAAGQGVVLSIDALFMTTVVVAMMASSADLRLALAAASPLLLLSVGLTYTGREVHRRFREVQEGFSRLTEFVEENIGGIRVVKALAREEQERLRFERIAAEQVERNVRLARVWAVMGPMTEAAVGVAYVIVLLLGGRLVVSGEVSLGRFVAFAGYLGMLIWPLTSIGWLINMVQRGRASLERLAALLAEQPDVEELPDAVSPGRLSGRIEVRHLTFTYPGATRPALSDVSFTVEPGQVVGIVGRTGAGKSTLAQLLLRLYDPPAGTILYDGRDIRSLKLEELRRQIGYVPQDGFLFSVSIADNIAMGLDPTHDEGDDVRERVEAAARLAHIHEDVMRFPQGYDSLVGERGVALSGGQKQRTSIARALVKDPPILILDDALSAVDAETERAILEDLRGVLRTRTAIVITHRLSAVREADQILVLDEGRVVERGTHAELLRRGGLYARLYERQRLEAELAAPEATGSDGLERVEWHAASG